MASWDAIKQKHGNKLHLLWKPLAKLRYVLFSHIPGTFYFKFRNGRMVLSQVNEEMAPFEVVQAIPNELKLRIKNVYRYKAIQFSIAIQYANNFNLFIEKSITILSYFASLVFCV